MPDIPTEVQNPSTKITVQLSNKQLEHYINWCTRFLKWLANEEGVIELFSHRDDCTSWIVSAFVVSDCNDETKAQGKKHLSSRVDAVSGERTPEAAVLH